MQGPWVWECCDWNSVSGWWGPVGGDLVSQHVAFSCRCCSQRPACCSSWTFGRTAVTSCSLSCIPPIAWASEHLQMCTPAPTFCSRPTLMQVTGSQGAAPSRARGFNPLVCGRLLRCGEKRTLLWSSSNLVRASLCAKREDRRVAFIAKWNRISCQTDGTDSHFHRRRGRVSEKTLWREKSFEWGLEINLCCCCLRKFLFWSKCSMGLILAVK